MQEYLLDSNIIIYYIKREPKIVALLKKLRREYFFISVITRIEVLMGAKTEGELEFLDKILRTFAPLDLNTKIALGAVRLEKKFPKKLKFKDLLIAATAQVEGLTLVTADKDFKKIKGLKVKLVKL
ncbi:MAG: PIN domain-containing protein [Patescibacteria group bacterium]